MKSEHAKPKPSPTPTPKPFPKLMQSTATGMVLLVGSADGAHGCLIGTVVSSGGSSYGLGAHSDAWGSTYFTDLPNDHQIILSNADT